MILLLDENLPRSWVPYLADEGIPATHWLQVGEMGAADEVIFAYAEKNKTVIVTQDLDFTRLLALRGARLPSIIQLRVDCPIPSVVGSALVAVWRDYRDALETGCLVSLEPAHHRLRLLPIR